MKEKIQQIRPLFQRALAELASDFFRPLAFIPNPLSFPKNLTKFFGI